MPSAPVSPAVSPAGSSAGSGFSAVTGTSPMRIAAEMSFAVFIDEMANPCSAAHASTENLPETSVAVVITGVAPSFDARSRAMRLAPPI